MMEPLEFSNLRHILSEVLLRLLSMIKAILLTAVLLMELLLDAEVELTEF